MGVKWTEEQKQARWDKQKKAARGMAKLCGIDLKKLAKERERNQREKMSLNGSRYSY